MAAYNNIPNPLLTTRVSVSAAQLNTSFATPIKVLPKTAGTIHAVDRVILRYVAESGSAVSTGANATVVRYTGGSTIASQDFAGLTAYTIYNKTGSVTTFTSTQTNVDIELATLVANPTFYGAIEVTIEYREIKVV